MAQYPIEIGDDQGVYDAVNYLLSGPGGLGQNYSGFSSFDPVYLRAVYRPPNTISIDTTLDPALYIDWPVTGAAPVGSNPTDQIQVSFTPTVALTNPPFQAGDILTTSGISPSQYNGTWTVLSSTTTTVNLYRLDVKVTFPAYSSGGRVGRDFANQPIGTDCLAQVSVSGYTDQPFVSAQISAGWNYVQDESGTQSAITNAVSSGGGTTQTYTLTGSTTYLPGSTVYVTGIVGGNYNGTFVVVSSSAGTLVVTGTGTGTATGYTSAQVSAGDSWYDMVFAIVRYAGFPSNASGNIDGFLYQFDRVVSRQTLALTADGATVKPVSANLANIVFSNIFDGPGLAPGAYAYELVVGFITEPNTLISGPRTRVGGLITNKFVAQGTSASSSGTYTGITPQLVYPQRAIPVANRAQVTVVVTADPALPAYYIGNNVTVTVTTPGGPSATTGVNDQVDGYKPGDQLLIPGTAIGGTSPANDLTLYVAKTQYPGSINPSIIQAGIRSLAAQVIKK